MACWRVSGSMTLSVIASAAKQSSLDCHGPAALAMTLTLRRLRGLLSLGLGDQLRVDRPGALIRWPVGHAAGVIDEYLAPFEKVAPVLEIDTCADVQI